MKKVLRRLLSLVSGVPLIPFIILLFFIFAGVLGGLITPHDPTKYNLREALIPPFWAEGGGFKNIFGTDSMGRDMLSRIIAGARISLIIGFTTVPIAGGFGCIIALVAGYLGGKVDTVLMRLTDTMLSMPYILVALALVGVLGASTRNLILVLAIIGWAGYARVIRGEVLRLRERDFIQLAIVSGCSKIRIIILHVFPNVVNTLIVMATLQLGVTILAEASLSFLGLGVPPPTPAWGSMVAEGRDYIGSAWWLSVFPGLAIMLVVLSCNFIGDWLRVRLDPKFRQI